MNRVPVRSRIVFGMAIVASSTLGVIAIHAQTTTTVVDATRTGSFGSPTSCSQRMVQGFLFSSALEVQITATGGVSLGPLSSPTPDGVPFFESASLFPLEEAFNDGGGLPPILSTDSSVNVGALTGAFVPEALASSAGFQPTDDDQTAVGIPSPSLFLVGSGPVTFISPGPGRLYLGINDTFACNNSGSYTVTITVPPDDDGDGVSDGLDVCPETLTPEGVPTRRLGVNRFALTHTDGVFDTTPPPGGGGGPQVGFNIADTAGCSCEQIIEFLELGNGHEKFGCSISAMEAFVALVNP